MTARIVAIVIPIALLALLGYGFYLSWKELHAELESTRVQLAQATAINESNAAVVQELLEQRKRDAETLDKLHEDLDGIRTRVGRTYDAVRKLGVDNALVRDYLSQPVPDALRGVLDGPLEAASPD